MNSQPISGTREKILQVSAGLFTQRGYAGTSTRDIAQRVGITQPGLYRHFPSKADIYLALADEILQPWITFARDAQTLETTAARKLLWLLNRICWSCADSPYEFAFLLTNSPAEDDRFNKPRKSYDRVLKLMAVLLEEGIQQRELREVDVRTALHMCMSLTDLLIFPTSGSADGKIREILALTAFGLMANRGAAAKALQWVLAGHRQNPGMQASDR